MELMYLLAICDINCTVSAMDIDYYHFFTERFNR